MLKKIFDIYTIHFKGLKVGKHTFQFEVDKAFFEQFERSEITSGKVIVDALMERQNSLLEIDFNIKGDVEVKCDRCLENFFIPTSFQGKLLVRISDSITKEENIDDVWYINSNEHEINLAQYIYESICLSLPIKRYHGITGTSADDCDPEMIDKLNKLSPDDKNEEQSQTDSRWDKLKDLMSN